MLINLWFQANYCSKQHYLKDFSKLCSPCVPPTAHLHVGRNLAPCQFISYRHKGEIPA